MSSVNSLKGPQRQKRQDCWNAFYDDFGCNDDDDAMWDVVNQGK